MDEKFIGVSPIYIDYYSRKLTGSFVEGTSCWAAARAMKFKGACRADLWPEDPSVIPSKAKIELADKDAFKRRSAFYQRCFTVDDVKAAVAYNGPVTISFRMYPSFSLASQCGIVPIPKSSEKSLGEHAVAIDGFDSDQGYTYPDGTTTLGFFRFANSWGRDWGDSGYGWLPYAYLYPYTTEIVATIPYKMIRDQVLSAETEIIEVSPGALRLVKAVVPGVTETHNNILFLDLYGPNSNLVGWLIASKVGPSEVEVIDLFVWPEYRYNGYGQILLDRFLWHERSMGTRRVYGWYSRDDAMEDGWLNVTSFFRRRGIRCERTNWVYPWASGRFDIALTNT